jgi:hypothetical protein
MMNQTPTFGTISNKTLIKRGKQVILMRKMDGFGVSLSSLKFHSFDQVEIHYLDKMYHATVDDFATKGIMYERPPFEKQVILPRRYWRVTQNTSKT